MGLREHRERGRRPVACVVVTASDTRTPATDVSGRRIVELLTAAGHQVVRVHLLPDDPEAIAGCIRGEIADGAVEAVIVNGGTGLAPRDTTYEAIEQLLDKRLDGFGELFRMLSFQEIGAAAMLSRATAGLAGRTAIFSMPGSPAAVELAMTRLVLPELGHIVHVAREG